MFDPISAAAFAVASVFASKALEGAGSQAGKAVTEAAGKLIAWLRRRGSEDPQTSAALVLLDSKPQDESRIAQLAEVIKTRAAGDPGFAAELLELVEATPEAQAVMMTGGAYIGRVSDHAKVTQIGRDQVNIGRERSR
jgi:hypothetical protein